MSANKLLNAALIGACVVTGVTAFRLLSDAKAPTPITIGSRVEVKIDGGSLGPAALSDIAAGKCAYVVIYSATCGACAALAHQWRQDLRGEVEPFPRSWLAVWVSTIDSTRTAPIDLPAPPVVHRFAVGNLERELALPGVPYFLVLNTQGLVVSAGIGGTVAAKARYRDDCTIAP